MGAAASHCSSLQFDYKGTKKLRYISAPINTSLDSDAHQSKQLAWAVRRQVHRLPLFFFILAECFRCRKANLSKAFWWGATVAPSQLDRTVFWSKHQNKLILSEEKIHFFCGLELLLFSLYCIKEESMIKVFTDVKGAFLNFLFLWKIPRYFTKNTAFPTK